MRKALIIVAIILTAVFIFSFTACTVPKTAIETTSAKTVVTETTIPEATSPETTASTTTATEKSTTETTIKETKTTETKAAATETTEIATAETTAAIPSGPLKIHFIDVGQGDAALIQTPEGNTVLIDGGPASNSSSLISYLKKNGVSKLNVVVATHPHEDHIGGLIGVLNNFTVDNIIDSGVSHTTNTYKNYLTTIQSKNINFVNWSLGQVFEVGNSLTMQIIGPVSKSSDLNNNSIVILLTYKNTKFLFAGDAESASETKIVSSGYNINADLLKVGHHGSKSSSTLKFLQTTGPSVAVISCGKSNSYGHPHEITLENLTKIGAAIYRTDISGTIVIESDGNNINVISGSPFTYIESTTTETTETVTTVAETTAPPETQPSQTGTYVGSIKSDVFHKPSCSHAKKILPENIISFSSKEDAISQGYRACKVCKP